MDPTHLIGDVNQTDYQQQKGHFSDHYNAQHILGQKVKSRKVISRCESPDKLTSDLKTLQFHIVEQVMLNGFANNLLMNPSQPAWW